MREGSVAILARTEIGMGTKRLFVEKLKTCRYLAKFWDDALLGTTKIFLADVDLSVYMYPYISPPDEQMHRHSLVPPYVPGDFKSSSSV